MYPHQNTPNEPDHNPTGSGDDHDRVVIPLPRKAPEDDVENLPKIAPDQDVWWYDQKQKRGGDRRFSGHINRVGGTEGERLRGELAAVIRDLLHWAAEQQSRDESTEDGEAA
ncbi:hypothetical protein [Saccharomonospora sp. CUA-673]|uniref:hypothetical protein n=1 Tax=Saccharomonospora sp. CUA-673 TaxID=1904969 RepID=UPI0011150D03|nr:hypothetical protein [Saccharomonospora sp. CUA-673]